MMELIWLVIRFFTNKLWMRSNNCRCPAEERFRSSDFFHASADNVAERLHNAGCVWKIPCWMNQIQLECGQVFKKIIHNHTDFSRTLLSFGQTLEPTQKKCFPFRCPSTQQFPNVLVDLLSHCPARQVFPFSAPLFELFQEVKMTTLLLPTKVSGQTFASGYPVRNKGDNAVFNGCGDDIFNDIAPDYG